MDREHYEQSFNWYVDILMQRDRVRKDTRRAQEAYIREFGDLIIETYQVRTDCLRKQRIISYCQQMIHLGRPIDGTQMDFIIGKHMEEKEQELEEILTEHSQLMEKSPATQEQDRCMDDLYREISLMIHPDIREDLAEDEACKEIWEKVTAAYTEDDQAAIELLREEVARFLKERSGTSAEADTDNNVGATGDAYTGPPELTALGMRIRQIGEEIRQITSSDPYSFLSLLADPDSVAEQKQALQQEIDRYTRYSTKLEEEIGELDIQR
jgi:hypothetical protein